ncbi:tetratricopeptide repeat protein [Stenomitos frigidus]|nr:tetratricopeptide repeat protein [Stenomitos frigidus]
MQLADRTSTTTPTHDRAQVFSGQNQKAYLRLKLAFSLNLRRQIFLAVCDDLALRNRLAARLYAELAYSSPKPLAGEATAPAVLLNVSNAPSTHNERFSVLADDRDSQSPLSSSLLPSRLLYPRLVSLNLNLSDPNPMVQIAEWLAQYPPPKDTNQRVRSPGFQILGTERLTRQPAQMQKRFLSSLQQVEHYLSCLEAPLLLWLPRPWLNAVQQSAPNFWNWHTALFEFEGDPTPVRSAIVRLDAKSIVSAPLPKQSAVSGAKQLQGLIDAPDSFQSFQSLTPASQDAGATEASVVALPVHHAIAQAINASSLSIAPASQGTAPQKENLWDILSHDLALLDDSQQAPSLPPQPEPDQSGSATEVTPPPISPAPNVAAVTLFSSDHSQAQQDSPNGKATNLVSESPVLDSPEVSAIVEPIDVPTQTPTADAAASNQSQAALELADLILAVVAEEGEDASSQNSRIIQALQQIEPLHLQQAPKATLLAAYQNLGNLCRDRVEQGNASSQHLLLAICVYEQTLQWLEDDSLQWSDVLNDIGNLYWMLSRQEPDMEASLTYLDQAIAAYQQALVKTNPETRPHNYAMIQNNLGSAYGDMARFRTPTESLEQSVAAYEAALRYRQLHDDPARYAATQNNLGTAYWNLAQHQQTVRRLKQSIAAYFEALRYYSPDCEPMHYAMIQNNLGTAYWNLAQQPQANLGVGTAKGKDLSAADLLQRAIGAYRAALRYRTLDVAPAAYAATQNNLGTAYWQLANLLDNNHEQRCERFQQAIVAYKAAIAAVEYLSDSTAHTPALSFDPAATHNNLGLAYYQLATDKHSRESSSQRSANLEAALHHHLQALHAWQPQTELYQTVFSYVIQTMRAFHTEFGSKGQTLALSKIPANLLPEVLKQL